MKRILLLTTFMFLGACAAEFNPDLDSFGETGSGTESDSSDSGDTSTSGEDGGSETSDSGSAGDGDGDGDGGGDGDGDTGGPEPYCGDDTVNGNEECDGDNMNGETCETQGFDFGTVSCNQDCTVNRNQCGVGACTQPENGPLSTCEVPQQGLEYCEGGELCLGEPGTTGYCSAGCDTDVECAVPGISGCEAAPRCVMNQCVYECGADYQCPNPMSCVFSEFLNTIICM